MFFIFLQHTLPLDINTSKAKSKLLILNGEEKELCLDGKLWLPNDYA